MRETVNVGDIRAIDLIGVILSFVIGYGIFVKLS